MTTAVDVREADGYGSGLINAERGRASLRRAHRRAWSGTSPACGATRRRSRRRRPSEWTRPQSVRPDQVAIRAIAAVREGRDPGVPRPPRRAATPDASRRSPDATSARRTVVPDPGRRRQRWRSTRTAGGSRSRLRRRAVPRARRRLGQRAALVRARRRRRVARRRSVRSEGVTAPALPEPSAELRAIAGVYRSHDPWTTNFRVRPPRRRPVAAASTPPRTASTTSSRSRPIGRGGYRVGDDPLGPERLSLRHGHRRPRDPRLAVGLGLLPRGGHVTRS